jgi:hypothetical protein
MSQTVLRGIKLTLASIFLSCLTLPCLAADPIGYAWPKNDLLITNTTLSRVASMKNGGTYSLIVKLDSGYSIVCEGADGQKVAALLPLNDRFGNPLTENVNNGKLTVSSHFVIMDTLDDYVRLKPGVVPLEGGNKYAVFDRSEGKLSIEFTFAEFTQKVSVAETDTKFLPLTDYNKAVDAVIRGLKSEADDAIIEGHPAAVSHIFKGYQGEYAQDSQDAREALAKEYAERVNVILANKEREHQVAQEKFQAEQAAKGLFLYEGQWLTTNEVAEAELQKEQDRQQFRRDMVFRSCSKLGTQLDLVDLLANKNDYLIGMATTKLHDVVLRGTIKDKDDSRMEFALQQGDKAIDIYYDFCPTEESKRDLLSLPQDTHAEISVCGWVDEYADTHRLLIKAIAIKLWP